MMKEECGSFSANRITYIDIAKAIGIFLVVLGHTVTSDTEIKRVLYSFHMPLFFLLSGVVMKLHTEWNIKSWKQFFIKKSNALLLPYLLWGLIYSSFSFKNLAFILYGTRETLIRAGSLTSLWFLPVMFIGYIISQFVLLCVENHKNKNLIIAIISVLFFAISPFIPHVPNYGDPFAFDVAIVATSFMLLGYLQKSIIKKLSDAKLQVLLIILTLLGISFFLSVHYSTSSVGYVLMANAIYGNILVFIINALLGSLIVIVLSIILSRIKVLVKPLSIVGQASLGVFLVHKPFVELSQLVCTRVLNNSDVHIYNEPVIAVLIAFTCLVISVVLVSIISRVIPGLFGKVYEKN